MDGEEEKGEGVHDTRDSKTHGREVIIWGMWSENRGKRVLLLTLFDKMMSYPIALHPHRHL